MDAELKTKWIGALRSGKFAQGRARLKNGAMYCCLGVLCAIKGVKFGDDDDVADTAWDGKYSSIMPEVPERFFDELWHRNDGFGSTPEHSFAEIADYIEANL